ncbi:Type-1 restriction enzyme EcoKI specificity protein [termite gut metagenome]|uniref:Type-1 restriction enzyme EcoKI specificity protein n=1 Tax=termite gut metagenome TaxID=433724 RepID=A0A5J4SXH7_9ZZZZ
MNNNVHIIPENWIQTSVGEIVLYTKGRKPDVLKEKAFKDSTPYLDINAFEKRVEKYADKETSILIKEDDIVIVWDGSRSGLVLKGKNGALGSTLTRINTFLINKTFIFYFLFSKYEYLNKNTKGIGIPHINPLLLDKLEIALPPLEEQDRIVEKIEELFSELNKAEETLKYELQRLKIYELSVLNKLFRKDTDGWKIFKIEDLFEFIGGGTPSKKQKQFWNGNINWATVKDINTKYINKTIDKITEDGVLNSSVKIANKGDILLVTRISPGKVTISNIEVAINQDLKIVLSKHKEYNPEFIYHLFCAYYKDIIELSSGTTVQGINLSQLNNIQVSIPPIGKCHEIVHEIDRIYSLTGNLSKEIEISLKRIETQRYAILKKAYRGQLISQKPKDEPASELLIRINEEKKLYLLNQKNMAQVKSKTKQPTKKLIEILFQKFSYDRFTYEDIKDTIFIPYDDLKNQLFSLLESNALNMTFDKEIHKIVYNISHENKKN